jgi:hypothetical protein
MTTAELQARAIQRAHDEHVYIRRTPRPGVYHTRSKSEPVFRHTLVVEGSDVACSCRGYEYRQSCKHVEALRNRLAREASRHSARRLSPFSYAEPLHGSARD